MLFSTLQSASVRKIAPGSIVGNSCTIFHIPTEAGSCPPAARFLSLCIHGYDLYIDINNWGGQVFVIFPARPFNFGTLSTCGVCLGRAGFELFSCSPLQFWTELIGSNLANCRQQPCHPRPTFLHMWCVPRASRFLINSRSSLQFAG